jgi:hypothetical protein
MFVSGNLLERKWYVFLIFIRGKGFRMRNITGVGATGESLRGATQEGGKKAQSRVGCLGPLMLLEFSAYTSGAVMQ